MTRRGAGIEGGVRLTGWIFGSDLVENPSKADYSARVSIRTLRRLSWLPVHARLSIAGCSRATGIVRLQFRAPKMKSLKLRFSMRSHHTGTRTVRNSARSFDHC